MTSRKQLLCLGMMAAFLAEGTLQAQADSVRRDSSRTRLTEIRVSAPRTSATVGGASAVVLSIDSLRLTPSATLEDGLREIPFVLVRQNSRGEVELSIRGSDSRQAAVLFDGLPLSTGWDHRSDPSAFPMSGVGNIILVRGLSSILQGPNSLGGVIDLGVASNRAGRIDGQKLRLNAGGDQLGTQSYQGDWATAFTAGAGEVTLRAGGGVRSRDAVRLSSDVADQYSTEKGRRSNSDVDQRDLYTALRYQTSGGAWVGASYSATTLERGVMPELHINAPRFWRYPDQNRHLTVVTIGTGRRRTPFGAGDMELVVGRNASYLSIHSFLDARYDSIVGTERGKERTSTARLLADHSVGRGELSTAFSTSTVRYTEILNNAAASEYEQRLWSTGAEFEMPLFATLRASVGYAADGSTTPQTGGKPSLGRLSEWGGRFGLSSLAFGNRARVHASVSRRARFAALRELYSGALNRFEPNPTLRPERLVGAEVGATLLGSRTQFQAVMFRHRLEDAIIRITQPDRRFKRINRDELRSHGIELLAGWNSGEFSLTGDATIQRVRLEDPAVAGTERKPEHQPEFRLGTDAVFPLGAQLRARLGLNHTGQQYCVNPDLGRNQQLKPQTWMTAGAERSFAVRSGGLLSRVLATLAVDNITDSAVYDQCGLPFNGRTLRFGLALH
ncbi:MAG: TonB-dependent receptor plug domain-containing protein [Gemmatimonadaceae bacterium]